jgi:hypothetical protein
MVFEAKKGDDTMINRYQTANQSNYHPSFYTKAQAAVPVKASENGPASSQTTAQTSQTGRFDQVDVTKDWKQMAIDTLNELSDKYENIAFGIIDFDSNLTLKNYASFLGKGQYLYMSTSFLEKMGSGPAEYADCASRLEQALKGMSDGAQNGLPEKTINQGVYLTKDQTAVWQTLLEEKPENPLLPKEDEKKNLLPWLTEEENKKSIFDQDLSRYSINTKNLLTSPGHAGMNVASARTVSQVQNAAFSAKHSLCQLRMALAFTTNDKDSQKLRQAIRQMEKVVRQAGSKVRDLQKMSEVKAKKERQIKERKRKEARKTSAILNKKKKERFAKDRQLSNESIGYLAQVRSGYAQENDERLNQIMVDLGVYSTDPMGLAALSGMTAGASGVAVEITMAAANAAIPIPVVGG